MTTTATVSDALLEKITALLRMAEHPNSNPNEAALALERAQALLLKHNLDRASLDTGNGKGETEKAGMLDLGYDHNWRPTLAHVIAKANLCRVIRSPADSKIHLFGTRTNVRVVLSMYLWIGEQLEGMALKDFKTYRASGGRTHGTTWKTSYFIGAVSTLRDRLAKPLEAFAQGEGRALVLYQKAFADRAVKGVFPHLARGSAGRATSNEGLTAGRQAGSRVSFSRPGTLTSGRLLLS